MTGDVNLIAYRDKTRTVTTLTVPVDDIDEFTRAADSLFDSGATYVTVEVDGEEYLADEWVKYLQGALRSLAPVA